MRATSEQAPVSTGVIAICGNPNSGKTTIFNAITGLNQQVANYPGVTVEKVSGRFVSGEDSSGEYTLIDIPGSYSLSAFTPDEYIAASVLFGEVKGEARPDAVICVLDATRLERSLYLLFQIVQIGCPVVVALNMVDLAHKKRLRINTNRLSRVLGGIPVVPVVGNLRKGIERLKQAAIRAIAAPVGVGAVRLDDSTEEALGQLVQRCGNTARTRAQYLRIIFDEEGPAEKLFLAEEGEQGLVVVSEIRKRIRDKYGSLAAGETRALTDRAEEVYRQVVRDIDRQPETTSEKLDKYLLHPVLGPVLLVAIMVLVFQSIFSWAAPFMEMIDSVFASLASVVRGNMVDGPLRSLITDGIIGGVGSVLVFIPQIAILFIFIALLEDSGYMPRAAFLVDRMFRWCGLSGKSFIPMLSSFACAIPGIMATRTIEDRKLRLITIMVAPLMTCSARLPVYAIMIAAFIPYKTYLGILNLQGLVLTMLYLLGIAAAVAVSYVMKKLIFKTERGTFMMEMPSYKIPTVRSIGIRVVTRVRSFLVRAGTIILAITVIIWALSYYPRSGDARENYNERRAALVESYGVQAAVADAELTALKAEATVEPQVVSEVDGRLSGASDLMALDAARESLAVEYSGASELVEAVYARRMMQIEHEARLAQLANERAGEQIRGSYLGVAGRKIEPLFEPLGWDWRITVSVLAAFPAREVIIATLGTLYNLGSDIGEQSSSLVNKMRRARWEDGSKKGQLVFSPPVALSIMVFFALCCQCGATLVTIRQEANHILYPVATFAYMTIMAYLTSLVVYQLTKGLGL
ncbi:MAG: ferrous iron transport protein B [Candidatus Zixiibacteriota bacterium]